MLRHVSFSCHDLFQNICAKFPPPDKGDRDG